MSDLNNAYSMSSIDLGIYKTGMLERTTSTLKNDFEFWRVI